jgi:caa(3)-type oxidase subunit IV
VKDAPARPAPVRTLLLAWGALLGLAAASYLAWSAGLWERASGGALAIATAKAALVAVFFMRLGAESRALRWILLILPAIVLLLFGLTMLDVAWR